jgi:hypothetical protein
VVSSRPTGRRAWLAQKIQKSGAEPFNKTLQRGEKMKPTTEAEEKEIADALESGVIELEKPSRKLLSDLKRASEKTFKKDRRINVLLCAALQPFGFLALSFVGIPARILLLVALLSFSPSIG